MTSCARALGSLLGNPHRREAQRMVETGRRPSPWPTNEDDDETIRQWMRNRSRCRFDCARERERVGSGLGTSASLGIWRPLRLRVRRAGRGALFGPSHVVRAYGLDRFGAVGILQGGSARPVMYINCTGNC